MEAFALWGDEQPKGSWHPQPLDLEQGKVSPGDPWGTAQAVLIGDHCKFPSQMEWKNAIKLIEHRGEGRSACNRAVMRARSRR